MNTNDRDVIVTANTDLATLINDVITVIDLYVNNEEDTDAPLEGAAALAAKKLNNILPAVAPEYGDLIWAEPQNDAIIIHIGSPESALHAEHVTYVSAANSWILLGQIAVYAIRSLTKDGHTPAEHQAASEAARKAAIRRGRGRRTRAGKAVRAGQ